jgi:uncharacterized OB-fold protein
LGDPILYPPLPRPTALTRHFWEGAAEHRLVMLRCQACGFWLHPPRPICRRCRSWDLGPEDVSGRGSLYTYTVTETPFHPYWADKVPYVVAVVTLEEQPDLRVITNVVDCPEDELRVGLPLVVTFVDAAPGLTLPVFRPAA